MKTTSPKVAKRCGLNFKQGHNNLYFSKSKNTKQRNKTNKRKLKYILDTRSIKNLQSAERNRVQRTNESKQKHKKKRNEA